MAVTFCFFSLVPERNREILHIPMKLHQGIKSPKSKLQQNVSALQVDGAESSTEESDRSTTPNPHRQQPHRKPPKAQPHSVPPPMWAPGFPGFPPGPPPMHAFKQVSRQTK